MKSFLAFMKKELLEIVRNGKLIIFGVIFFVFGVSNPVIAKITPWLFELLEEDFAQIGVAIPQVVPTAMDSWAQFFNNIPMALIVFVVLFSNMLTKEYNSGSLILILTKGLERYKILLSKFTVASVFWTVGYWLCFVITYGINAFLWDNSVAIGLFPAVINWWFFGIFIICLILLFSSLFKNYIGVLLGVFAVVLLSYIFSFIPSLSAYLPTSLMDYSALLLGTEKWLDTIKCFVVTALLSGGSICVSIPIFNKKQL